MKTKLTISLIALFFSMIQLHADDLKFKMADEAYINDIPFNTEVISNENKMEQALQLDFNTTEEDFINDIPFDTQEIALTNPEFVNASPVFKMADEAYIDDIPFDTAKIVADK
ncbi:MAG: hypothetical protein Q8T08_24165 [Ignavibacteria bacterium]|nr:hypothetical protein [Ignavibacteria bacterium]